jgi:hypothetical protein
MRGRIFVNPKGVWMKLVYSVITQLGLQLEQDGELKQRTELL